MKNFNIQGGILREYPQPMGVENAVEAINNLKGNFRSIMFRDDSPKEVLKKAQKNANRNFIKFSIHYFILGKKHYTKEQIAEFQAKGDRDNLNIISKNLREKEGTIRFFGRFNKHFRSKIIYVDTNTNEVFTKSQMAEMNMLGSNAYRDKSYNEGVSIPLYKICEI